MPIQHLCPKNMRQFKRVMITGPEATQAPFAEYDELTCRWRVWQSFNSDVSAGTYLDFYPSGQVDRVTVNPDDSFDIVIISGPSP